MTGANAKIKRIYVGDNYLVYPQWKVNSNTVAYYPLTDDFNDATGNYNMTGKAGSPSITTLNGVKCLRLNGSSDIGNDNLHSSVIGNTWTICGWINCDANKGIPLLTLQGPNDAHGYYVQGDAGRTYGVSGKFDNNGSGILIQDSTPIPSGTWKHICVTISSNSSGTANFYQNGTLTKTQSNVSFTTGSTNSYARVGGSKFSSSGAEQYFGAGYVSRLIIENRAWTAQEVKDYYNGTKAIYFGYN